LAVLQSARWKTKPTTVDMYETFCAVPHVLKSGCQWRMLPRDFPKWGQAKVNWISALKRALKKIWLARARQQQGRSALTRLLIVDAQSVKNTDTAEQKGYDTGKKELGIKRHIAVDTQQGLPHARQDLSANTTAKKDCPHHSDVASTSMHTSKGCK
jgi:transposase